MEMSTRPLRRGRSTHRAPHSGALPHHRGPGRLRSVGCSASPPSPDAENTTRRPSGDQARPSSPQYSPARVRTVPVAVDHLQPPAIVAEGLVVEERDLRPSGETRRSLM